ncbi:periplasmic heavy metal sensor [Aliiroseovarius crassostreae]|uniref:periplasmic heavy metal sensor n=1 Tax=Aliiroseovarius crassostreae TaxID=154981 RepID=UPI003C7CC7D1
MTDIQTPQPPKSRKWVKLVFALSLTLNLLVVGMVVGAKVAGGHDHGFNPRGPDGGMIRDLGFGPLASALPRKDRRAIGKAFRAERGSFTDHRAAIRRDFVAMMTVLQTEPFDAGALQDLMQAQKARISETGDTLQQLVIERISLMTPEERKEFAEKVAERVHFDARRGDKDRERRRD